MKLKGILVGLAILMSIVAVSQTKKEYKSLLWEISGNGLTKPSYLYGTMHLSNKVAFNLSDSFYVALKNCDAVGLELNPNNWLKDFLESDLLQASYNMINSLGLKNNDFYKNAFGFKEINKYTYKITFADNPEIINNLLYRFNSLNDNYEENTYLDLFIFQAGSKLKKEIHALEDFNYSIKMLIKAMTPDDNDKLKSNKTVNIDNLELLPKIEEAYRNGDLDLLDSLTKQTLPSKNYTKYLIDARNIIMAHSIDSLIKTRTLFAAFGAAHLPGENGIINILRKKGYTIRPIAYSQTKYSEKTKDKIDNTFHPQTFVLQYSSDSLFQFEAPGKLITLNATNENESSVYTDMVNGDYFSINRLKTYGFLINKNEDYIFKQIDSLLYENIPGKIIKKEIIKSNCNYPGFNIISKTKRGDFLHFNIFISPLEVIIFKIGGTGEYGNSKDAEKLFKSIKFFPKTNQIWTSYTSNKCGFSVKCPSYRIINEYKPANNQDSKYMQVFKMQAYDNITKDYYMLNIASYFDFAYIEEDTFELSYLAENFYKDLNLELISKKYGTYENCPSLDLNLKNKDNPDHLFMRLFIRGPLYYLMVSKQSENKWPENFFNSFHFSNYIYCEPYKEYTDSTLHFSVKTSLNRKGEEFEQLVSVYKNINNINNNMEYLNYLGKDETKNYSSLETPEIVQVNYFKLSKYAYIENNVTCWNDAIKHFSNNGDLIVKEKKISIDSTELNLLLTDTGSTRAIKIKSIISKNAIYTIFTTTDTLNKLPEWTSTFFNTFQPTNTDTIQTIYQNKTTLLLENLLSQDSIIKKQADYAITTFRFEEADAKDVYSFINNKDFSKLDINVRTDIMRNLGVFKSLDFIPTLKKLYINAGDTSSIQLAILKSLADMKRTAAIKAFGELIKKETPLVENNYQIYNIFDSLCDTLEISKLLFPDLLDLMKYDEYKENIAELLARIIDKKLIDKSLYLNYKKDILREASDELKRLQSQNESNNNDFYYDDDDFYDFAYDLNYNFLNNPDYVKHYGSKIIDYYCEILLPFREEPAVKSFFDKVSKAKDDHLLLYSSLLYLKNDLPVNDTVWTRFSKDYLMNTILYYKLASLNKLDKFDKNYLNQETISKYSVYPYNFDPKTDSILFIKKELITLKNSNLGYVYFFKTKTAEDESWTLVYSGLQPADSSKIEIYPTFFNSNKEIISNKKDIQKMISEYVKKIELSQRKRVAEDGANYNFFDGLDY